MTQALNGPGRPGLEPMIVPSLNKVYVPIAKNGYTTLGNAIANKYRKEVYIWDGEGFPDVYVMWRNPIDRFESGWRYLTQSEPNRKAPWEPIDINHFTLAMLENGMKDIHLKPQHFWEPKLACDCLLHRIPWNFVEFAEAFELDELPVTNPTLPVPKDWNWDIFFKLCDFLREDLDIWERINDRFSYGTD